MPCALTWSTPSERLFRPSPLLPRQPGLPRLHDCGHHSDDCRTVPFSEDVSILISSLIAPRQHASLRWLVALQFSAEKRRIAMYLTFLHRPEAHYFCRILLCICLALFAYRQYSAFQLVGRMAEMHTSSFGTSTLLCVMLDQLLCFSALSLSDGISPSLPSPLEGEVGEQFLPLTSALSVLLLASTVI